MAHEDEQEPAPSFLKSDRLYIGEPLLHQLENGRFPEALERLLQHAKPKTKYISNVPDFGC